MQLGWKIFVTSDKSSVVFWNLTGLDLQLRCQNQCNFRFLKKTVMFDYFWPMIFGPCYGVKDDIQDDTQVDIYLINGIPKGISEGSCCHLSSSPGPGQFLSRSVYLQLKFISIELDTEVGRLVLLYIETKTLFKLVKFAVGHWIWLWRRLSIKCRLQEESWYLIVQSPP